MVDFGNPVGSEPGFVRPAALVTAQAVLDRRPRTVHVVPITSNVGRSLPTEVRLDSDVLPKPSAAQCHLITVISVERIIGTHETGRPAIGATSLAQLRVVLAEMLDID